MDPASSEIGHRSPHLRNHSMNMTMAISGVSRHKNICYPRIRGYSRSAEFLSLILSSEDCRILFLHGVKRQGHALNEV